MNATQIAKRYWPAAVCVLALAGIAAAYFTSPDARSAIRIATGVDDNAPAPAPDDPSHFSVEGDRVSVPAALVQVAGVKWQRVDPAAAPRTLLLTGRTALNMETVTHVHTQFPGKITSLGPALGAQVRGPGDGPSAGNGPAGGATLLCRIESVDLAQAKSDYQKAKVQLAVDEDTKARTKVLVESGVVSDKAQFDAENAVRRSTVDFEIAKQKLMVFGLTEEDIKAVDGQSGRERMAYDLYAPRSGVIAEKNVTPGEISDATINLFTIADLSTLWVWGDVYERDWAKVKVGQPMSITVAGRPDQPLSCTIDWISPVIDGTTRSVRIRGLLNNADRRLLADMYANLKVTLDGGEGSLVVPRSGVVRKGDAAWVFVLVEGDGAAGGSGNAGADARLVFRRTPVRVESIDAQNDRVISGLNPGDTVVMVGALRLNEEAAR